MEKQPETSIIPDENLLPNIYLIRGEKVMLDKDLAKLYEVETKALNQAVRRNMEIFPEHFMFELTQEEFQGLRSQIVTSNPGRGGTRYLPMAFTEHGILQLAGVIRSSRAKQVSIRIIEVFIKMRKALLENTEIRLEVENIKKKLENQGKNMELIFMYLDELLEKQENPTPGKRLGLRRKNDAMNAQICRFPYKTSMLLREG